MIPPPPSNIVVSPARNRPGGGAGPPAPPSLVSVLGQTNKKKADKHDTGAMAESPEPIGSRGRDGLHGVVGFRETEMRRCRCRVRGRCQTGRAAGRGIRTQI